ncbi:MAG: DEAD/DEAH box helicase [Candidatus Thorarchaeota archaeon]
MTNITNFKDLGVIEPILRVCAEQNYTRPTEIQTKSIPHVLENKDVIGEAATGSGKTLAFASGIIKRVVRGKGVQALVITPTRELALQVTEMIQLLSKYKPLRIHTIYGGVSINPQIRDLRKADVVIATPGRLIDHITRRTIDLGNTRILVLDECDRLLDMGFLPDVERIINTLPKHRQTLLYSATVPFEVSRLALQYMKDPVEVDATPFVDPEKLTQYYFGPVNDSLKFSLLAHLLKERNGDGLTLIFSNTRRNVDFLVHNLNEAGISATALHGGFSQRTRESRLSNFKNHRSKVLVATDVAARGLDIPKVTDVYNYDLPENRKQYIHRIGRTARAGKTGKAITLVSQRDNERFFQLFQHSRNEIQKGKVPKIQKIPTNRLKTKNNPRGRRNNIKRRINNKKPLSRYSI